MQVLLFLTALLSALTGVISAPQGDDSRPAQAEQRLISAVEAAAPAAIAAIRPLVGFLPLVRDLSPSTRPAPMPPRPTLVGTVLLIE